MSIEITDVARYASEKATEKASDGAGVKVLNKARDSAEAVVGTLLQGIDNSRGPGQTGQNLNIKA